MAYEKQNWISYDDNKTEEQNIQDGAVVTAERMNHIEQGLVEHEKDKENPHEVTAHQVGALTAEESSVNVINQISGAESAFAKKEFLVNGVEGTGARENNDSFTPFSPEDYASLVSDTGVVRVETLIDGRGAESEFQFPLINIIGERYPDFFEGLSTIAEKITRCKDKIRKVIVPSEFRGGGARYTGTGSVSNYSRLYIKNISNDNGGFWGTTATNSTASYRAFNTVIDATSMKQIQPDGSYVFKIVTKNNKSSENGIVSDGTTAAWIEIKDLRLIVEIEMNGRTLILSMMATYYGKNLGNVDNYETATQVDAESGTATDKFMTPLRTKQHVSSRIASQTEAESGTATEKLMTPLRTKQHVDKRIATKAEVNEGEATDKLVSPKTLADLLSKKMPLKMYWGPGSTLKDSNLNDRLTFGDLIGIDPFHKSSDIPFTINSGKYEATMTRDADLFFDINLRLQGGGASTVYSDYYYIQLEYGSQTGGSGESKKDFAMIGANNGQRLNLSNTLTGKAIVSLKKGQKFAITATGLRSGQKIFSWQFLSGTIEEYILT
jgi:hypothetical protein